MIECKNNGRSSKPFDELKAEAQEVSTLQVMNYALQVKQNAVLVKYRRVSNNRIGYIYRVGKKYFYAEEREDSYAL